MGCDQLVNGRRHTRVNSVHSPSPSNRARPGAVAGFCSSATRGLGLRDGLRPGSEPTLIFHIVLSPFLRFFCRAQPVFFRLRLSPVPIISANFRPKTILTSPERLPPLLFYLSKNVVNKFRMVMLLSAKISTRAGPRFNRLAVATNLRLRIRVSMLVSAFRHDTA